MELLAQSQKLLLLYLVSVQERAKPSYQRALPIQRHTKT